MKRFNVKKCIPFIFSLAALFFLQNSYALSIPEQKPDRTITTDISSFNSREIELISHVQISIQNAEKGISKLTPEVLSIYGMSSAKVRHLLNNVCSLPNTHYLEIGCWEGSTWVGALYGNKMHVSQATVIDDWSQFGNAKDGFMKNCAKFLSNMEFQMLSMDCFQVDLNKAFNHPITVYFYDGDNSFESQESAFLYFDPILDDTFIAIVYNWNWNSVSEGTFSAFERLGYEVLFEQTLPAYKNGDLDQWWNGLYIAVIRKSKNL